MTQRRALLVSHDAGGTVPPMLALATALVERGTAVTVLGQPSIEARAEAAGCRFVAFSGIGDYETGRSLEEQLEVTAEVITGRGPGDDLLAVADDDGTDVVVVDCNLAGAAAAAETLGIPSAVLLHSMYRTFVDTWFGTYWPFMEPAINETRRAYGLDPCRSWSEVFSHHDRMLAVVPESFDAPTKDRPATMRHFGFLQLPAPAAPDDAALPDGEAPLVLVSLSTTYQHQEPLLATIMEALGDLPVRVLVTAGIAMQEAALRPPPNVTLRRFVPHGLVLPHTDLVVTHGGLGTIAAALSHGVPLVCAPIARDQPLNAQRVNALGAGRHVGVDPTPADVAEAVIAVLADPSYRRAAAVTAAASRDAGGSAAAAADVLALS